MDNNGYLNKHTIIELITKSYHSFINYVNELTKEEFVFVYQQKWTAGQQLQHLVLSVKPLVNVLSIDKITIEQNFGTAIKPSSNYDSILHNLKTKLQEGGKAPDRFLPEVILPEQRNDIRETLIQLIEELSSKIGVFTEQELDILMLPHPLLGKITIREMLYITIYHAEHHYRITQQNLTNK